MPGAEAEQVIPTSNPAEEHATSDAMLSLEQQLIRPKDIDLQGGRKKENWAVSRKYSAEGNGKQRQFETGFCIGTGGLI